MNNNNMVSGYDSFAKVGERLKQNKMAKRGLVTSVNLIEKKAYRKNRLPALNNLAINTVSVVNTGSLKLVSNEAQEALRRFKSRDIDKLPEKVMRLRDNKCFLNRDRKLAREHGIEYLEKLAELTVNNANVNFKSRYYAKCTSIEKWKLETLPMLTKLFKKIDEAAAKLKEIGINKGSKYFYYFLSLLSKLSEYETKQLMEAVKRSWVRSPDRVFNSGANQFIKGDIPTFLSVKYNPTRTPSA